MSTASTVGPQTAKGGSRTSTAIRYMAITGTVAGSLALGAQGAFAQNCIGTSDGTVQVCAGSNAFAEATGGRTHVMTQANQNNGNARNVLRDENGHLIVGSIGAGASAMVDIDHEAAPHKPKPGPAPEPGPAPAPEPAPAPVEVPVAPAPAPVPASLPAAGVGNLVAAAGGTNAVAALAAAAGVAALGTLGLRRRSYN